MSTLTKLAASCMTVVKVLWILVQVLWIAVWLVCMRALILTLLGPRISREVLQATRPPSNPGSKVLRVLYDFDFFGNQTDNGEEIIASAPVDGLPFDEVPFDELSFDELPFNGFPFDEHDDTAMQLVGWRPPFPNVSSKSGLATSFPSFTTPASTKQGTGADSAVRPRGVRKRPRTDFEVPREHASKGKRVRFTYPVPTPAKPATRKAPRVHSLHVQSIHRLHKAHQTSRMWVEEQETSDAHRASLSCTGYYSVLEEDLAMGADFVSLDLLELLPSD